jgi:hypothetical protein
MSAVFALDDDDGVFKATDEEGNASLHPSKARAPTSKPFRPPGYRGRSSTYSHPPVHGSRSAQSGAIPRAAAGPCRNGRARAEPARAGPPH